MTTDDDVTEQLAAVLAATGRLTFDGDRYKVAAALLPVINELRPETTSSAPPEHGRIPAAHGLLHHPSCAFNEWREQQPPHPLPPDRPGNSTPPCTCGAIRR